MSNAVLIDYGCHSFTYRLATRLGRDGYPIRYYANGSLESPNLASLHSWEEENPEIVTVIKCCQAYGKMSLAQRLKGEIEWAAQCIKSLKNDRPSAVVTSCVPLAVVTRIQSWCKRHEIPLIYWLQDIQGRAMHDLLGRKLGFAGRVAGSLAAIWEQEVIEQSQMVITIAAGHERQLPLSLRRSGNWRLLENWANIEEIPVWSPDNDWSAAQGLADTLNVIYSGTLGLKHDLDTFLALAAGLRQRPKAKVVVVSTGEAADQLRSRAAAQHLTNLLVLPFQPYKDVPKVLASAAVLIAPLDASAGSFCVPSKVLSYLCAGRPTVLAIDPRNPAASVLEGAGAGTVVPPGDSSRFVGAVCNYLDNAAARSAAGTSARAYAETTFSSVNVTKKFLAILADGGVPLAPSARISNCLHTAARPAVA